MAVSKVRKSSGRDARAPRVQEADPPYGEEGARCLSPEDLGAFAKQLVKSTGLTESAQLRERLTLGFYGI